MHVLTVVGARPQFIKASPVSAALKHAGDAETLIHTGQHYDDEMSRVFFDELEIKPPDVNLEVGSGPHGWQTAAMLTGLERVFAKYDADWILVYGDTNSTLAGALAASKMHLRLAHVEAGLRSYNRSMPEEVNRVVTDAVSDLLLAPTTTSLENLSKEGVPAERVRLVGDVMLDAARMHGDRAAKNSRVLERLTLAVSKYALVTIHRAENTDDPTRLKAIAHALGKLAEQIPVVFPLHPRTRGRLDALGLTSLLGRSTIVPPVGFLDMVMLERSAGVIVTDSGGVQKEAFFHRIPCVTLRSETEWVELISLGWNRLCQSLEPDEIVACVVASLASRGQEATPYGDGTAAQRIVRALHEVLD